MVALQDIRERLRDLLESPKEPGAKEEFGC